MLDLLLAYGIAMILVSFDSEFQQRLLAWQVDALPSSRSCYSTPSSPMFFFVLVCHV
jgi:hypothetical protein